jgi:hypothetical protein
LIYLMRYVLIHVYVLDLCVHVLITCIDSMFMCVCISCMFIQGYTGMNSYSLMHY